MGRIIAIANQKGGVGKTTTAINLSSSLASMGKKVLSLDMDPQGNMTSGLGVDKDEAEKTVYDLIIGNAGVEECICRDALENIDVLPSNIDLSAAEIELIGVDNKEYILKNEIDKVYIAKIKGIILPKDLMQLKNGVVIDGRKTKKARIKLKKIDKINNTSIVELTIHEGRNHQVKKMFESIGYEVLKLKREKIAFLDLSGLKSGEYRKLNPKEVKKLYAIESEKQ